MDKEKLKSQIQRILAGIDQVESDSPDGWWKTSVGAQFGSGKLDELM